MNYIFFIHLLFLLESLVYYSWIDLLFLLVLILEMNMSSPPQFSSLHHCCWTLHNSSGLRILSPIVSWQKIHNHLQQLDVLYKSNPTHFFSKMMIWYRYQTHNLLLSQTLPTSLHLILDLPTISHTINQHQECQLVWQFNWFGWLMSNQEINHHAYKVFYLQLMRQLACS